MRRKARLARESTRGTREGGGPLMGGKTLPPLELECSGCGHRWPTRAAAGSTIKCPQCRRGRRVPAERPGTAAPARAGAIADDSEAGRLAALWAAEQPAAGP